MIKYSYYLILLILVPVILAEIPTVKVGDGSSQPYYVTINQSMSNVNNSEYWDGHDTPATIDVGDFNDDGSYYNSCSDVSICGYLTHYDETDPIWSSQKSNYYNKTASDARYLQGFSEQDPNFTNWVSLYKMNISAFLQDNATTINNNVYNITNNLTNNISYYYNTTNNLTNYVNTTYNITNNLSYYYNTTNNLTNYVNTTYNITNNLSYYYNTTNNITNNYTTNYDDAWINSTFYNKTASDARYLQGFSEQDPNFTSWKSLYVNNISAFLTDTDTDDQTCAEVSGCVEGAITGYNETDPIFDSWKSDYANNISAFLADTDTDTNDTARVDALYLNISNFLADTDTDDQTCAEVSGCVPGAITGYNETDPNFTSWKSLYVNNISAFLTDTDTDDQTCAEVSGCVPGAITGYNETDPAFSAWRTGYNNNISAYLADTDTDTNDTARVDALYLNISNFLADTDTDTNDTARVDALYDNITVFLTDTDTDTNDTARVDALYDNITAFLADTDTDTNDTSRVDALYSNISVFLADTDTDDQTCAEVSGCVTGAITGYNETDPIFSSWKSDYANNISAFLADTDTDTNDTARVDALYDNITVFLADVDTNDTARVDALYLNISNFLADTDTDTNDTARVDALYLNISNFLADKDTDDQTCAEVSGCVPGAITGYNETDPNFSSWKSDYNNNISAFLQDNATTINNNVYNITNNLTNYVNTTYNITNNLSYYYNTTNNITNNIVNNYTMNESDPAFSAWQTGYNNNISAYLADTNDTARVDALYDNITVFLADTDTDTNDTARVDALYLNISNFLADTDTNDTARVDALYLNISNFLEDNVGTGIENGSDAYLDDLNVSSLNNVLYVQAGNASDIQAKINMCKSGCNIYLPPGEYLTNNTITINKKGISLIGHGYSGGRNNPSNTTIIRADSGLGANNLINVEAGAYLVQIEKIVLDGDYISENGINIEGTNTRYYLNYISTQYNNQNGILINSGIDSDSIMNYINAMENKGNGIRINRGDVTINGYFARNNTLSGIYIESGTAEITNIHPYGNGNCIYINGSRKVKISSFSCETSSNDAEIIIDSTKEEVSDISFIGGSIFAIPNSAFKFIQTGNNSITDISLIGINVDNSGTFLNYSGDTNKIYDIYEVANTYDGGIGNAPLLIESYIKKSDDKWKYQTGKVSTLTPQNNTDNISIGYTGSTLYRLAVNGTGYFGGKIDAASTLFVASDITFRGSDFYNDGTSSIIRTQAKTDLYNVIDYDNDGTTDKWVVAKDTTVGSTPTSNNYLLVVKSDGEISSNGTLTIKNITDTNLAGTGNTGVAATSTGQLYKVPLFTPTGYFNNIANFSSSVIEPSELGALKFYNNISNWTSILSDERGCSYDEGTHKMKCNNAYMTDLVNDTTPDLGGNLNANSKNISSVSNIILAGDTTNHKIYDNSTCIIIKGDTSELRIC